MARLASALRSALLDRHPYLRTTATWTSLLRDTFRIHIGARRARGAPDEFDHVNDVRTRVLPTPGELVRILRCGGFPYEPSSPAHVRETLEAADVRFEDTVFVDYGSGAGRVVLLAAGYPFREVVGIELSPSLHARARANLDGLGAERRRAAGVRLVCGNVTEYALPDHPLVLYFYNPFGARVMRRVLDIIEASLARRPRPVTIILVHCYREPRDVVTRSPWFRVVRRHRGIAILRSVDRAGRPPHTGA